jgi:hypothetical protein
MNQKPIRSVICATCIKRSEAYEVCLVCGVGICQPCAAKANDFCKKCLGELPGFLRQEGVTAFLRNVLRESNREDTMAAIRQPFLLLYYCEMNGSFVYSAKGFDTKEALESFLKDRLLQGDTIEYLFFDGKIQKYRIAKFELEFS